MNFIGIDLHTNRFTHLLWQRAVSGRQGESQGAQDLYSNRRRACATLTIDTMVLLEATITSFSFTRLIQERVKEVIIANT